jgi:hypothetical protein
MTEITKSYLLARVADLTANEVILNELKSFLALKAKQTNFTDLSLASLIILDKIRQLEYRYKGEFK